MTEQDVEIKSLLYDNSFKHILLEEPKILANILCILLGIDFDYNYTVEIHNSELIKEFLKDDKLICDIVIKINDKTFINCEVNKEGYTDYKRYRNEKYYYSIYNHLCNHSKKYEDMTNYKLYQVNINGTSGISDAISIYIKENISTKEPLLKNMVNLNVDVAKCKKMVYNYTNDSITEHHDKRVYLGAMFGFTNLEKIRELLMKGGIKKVNIDKIIKIIKEKNKNDEFLGIISAEEEHKRELAFTESEALYKGEKRGEERGEKRGIAIGEKRGEERGEKKKEVEITKNLLKEGLPEKMISKVTSLSLSEINAIKLNLF